MGKKLSIVFITLAAALLVSGFSLYFLLKHSPVVVKPFYGTGRVLFPPMEAVVAVNGQVVEGARCFRVREYFHGGGADQVVLWLPEESAFYGREVIIIDRSRRKAGYPVNASTQGYEMVFGRFLFQSDGGSYMIPFDDGVKGPGYEPLLMVDDAGMPGVGSKKDVRIVVALEE